MLRFSLHKLSFCYEIMSFDKKIIKKIRTKLRDEILNAANITMQL